MKTRHRWAPALLAFATLCMATSLIHLFFALISDEAAREREFRESLLWSSVQVERESAQFLDIVTQFHYHNPPRPKEDVLDAFDLLWSWVEGTRSGSLGRLYQTLPKAPAISARAMKLLGQLEPVVGAFEAGDDATYRRITAEIRQLGEELHLVALDANQFENLEKQRRRLWFAGFYSRALMLFAGVLLSGGLLIALIFMNERKLEGLRRSLEQRVQSRTTELRGLRNLLRNMIDSMPSALIGVDRNCLVMQWNRGAEEMTGVSANAAHGRGLSTLFPQLGDKLERVAEAIESGTAQQPERLVDERSDSVKHTEVSVFPLLGNGVEGAVVRIDDVTERVQIEEVMIQSEKMLSVGGLAAGMAHEINNPLAGILQNAQVMRNRLLGELPQNRQVASECGTTWEAIKTYFERRSVGAMLDAITDSGQRAAQIVDNMLSFSRKSDSHFRPHDIPALLEQTIELVANDYDLKKSYDFRQIEIVRDFQDDLPLVACAAGEIQQVLLNLLKNSAQAMVDASFRRLAVASGADAGTSGNVSRLHIPRLTVRAYAAYAHFWLEVEDNGPGMSEAVRKRVFEPFFTTKDVGLGTGLGLSVSYFIVTDIHSGSMAVESAPGKGSKFVISLPLERTSDD